MIIVETIYNTVFEYKGPIEIVVSRGSLRISGMTSSCLSEKADFKSYDIFQLFHVKRVYGVEE